VGEGEEVRIAACRARARGVRARTWSTWTVVQGGGDAARHVTKTGKRPA